VSLAHHGILFLDELPEFLRRVLEVLRQPIDDGIAYRQFRVCRQSGGNGRVSGMDEPIPDLADPMTRRQEIRYGHDPQVAHGG
jgi:hypothetical protein